MSLLFLWACQGNPTDSAGETGAGSETSSPDSDTDSGEVAPVAGCETTDALAWGEDVCVDAAGCRLSGEQSYEYLGYSLAAGEDIDGDGLPDIVAGSLGYDEEDTAYAGRAVLVSGSSFVEGTPAISGSLLGTQSQAYVGHSVAMSPDVDGDGLGELLVGGYGWDEPDDFAGSVHLVLGAEGLSGSLAPAATWTGESHYAHLGYRVAAPGDLDGDGLAELAFTGELKELSDDGQESYREGRVYVVAGRAGLTGGSAGDADAQWDGTGSRAAAGMGVAGADLDGDGDRDLAIAAPYAESYYGRVYLIDGQAALTGGTLDEQTAVAADAYYSGFGVFLAAADLTGDGAAELLVGAPADDRAFPDAGAVHIYGGGADALDAPPERLAVITGAWDDAWVGSGLAAGGDIDGDGLGDALVGAITAYTGLRPKNGRVGIYTGRTTWADAQLTDAELRFHGVGTKDYLGQAQALTDLDADGHADVLLGSGFHDGAATDAGMLWVFHGG